MRCRSSAAGDRRVGMRGGLAAIRHECAARRDEHAGARIFDGHRKCAGVSRRRNAVGDRLRAGFRRGRRHDIGHQRSSVRRDDQWHFARDRRGQRQHPLVAPHVGRRYIDAVIARHRCGTPIRLCVRPGWKCTQVYNCGFDGGCRRKLAAARHEQTPTRQGRGGTDDSDGHRRPFLSLCRDRQLFGCRRFSGSAHRHRSRRWVAARFQSAVQRPDDPLHRIRRYRRRDARRLHVDTERQAAANREQRHLGPRRVRFTTMRKTASTSPPAMGCSIRRMRTATENTGETA